MRSFKDSKSNTWDISLPFGAIARVKSESDGKFNLLEPLGDDLYKRLNSDLGEFYEVLWFLVRPQAESKGFNAEQFGELIAADCIFEAHRKFFEEWADFFRNLQRKEVAVALETTAALNAKALEAINRRVEAETKGLVERTTPKINELLNSEFGNFQALLDKTLGPAPGGN